MRIFLLPQIDFDPMQDFTGFRVFRTSLLSKPWSTYLATALCCLIFSGCGAKSDAPDTYEFSGVLTHKGAPVTGAVLMFQPSSGRPSISNVESDGSFEMRYTASVKGVAVGAHTVYLVFDDTNPDAVASDELNELLKKYSRDESPYKLTVDKDEKDFKLELE